MAEEAEAFDFVGVVATLVEKMTRRHPHIFGDSKIASAEAQSEAWETQKAAERAAKAGDRPARVLDGLPLALPALLRAAKIQSRLARVGFVWPDVKAVLADLREELAELEAELTPDANKDRIEDELGDLLFVAANLGRFLGVDPEAALRRTNAKVERRFGAVEDALKREGRTPKEASLEELDRLWDKAKAAEKK
jgi:MazG family protein